MGIGGGNPIPEQIGGGRSLVERIYWAMRSTVGEHNYAPEDVPGTTIEGSWRWCRALALAAMQGDERSITDMFFARCTDTIPVFEDLLGITALAAASDEDRRQEIINLIVHGATAIHATLEDELQTIDPLFTVVYASQDYADVTGNVRAFEDYVPADPDACGPAFGGGRSSTGWPNYSSNYICLVQYGVAIGAISSEQKRRIVAAQDVLNRALPAWVDYMIVADPTGGFILDLSILDLGSFGS
jgi:hypothetical protein